jgi:hypothetical protein
MNEETLNTSIRKLLKTSGVNAQREIEQAVASAISSGKLVGNETFRATMTLEIPSLHVNVRFDGDIKLE